MLSQAQYEQRGKSLYLRRWRVIIDGIAGAWRPKVDKQSNGGWPKRMAA